ncbi:hypothetical protein R6Q59_030061 [Mikania micrantha]
MSAKPAHRQLPPARCVPIFLESSTPPRLIPERGQVLRNVLRTTRASATSFQGNFDRGSELYVKMIGIVLDTRKRFDTLEFKRFLKNRSFFCCDSFFDSGVCSKLNDLFDAELTRFRNRIEIGKDLTQLTTYRNMWLQNGWKNIYGDVFRFPNQKSLLSAVLGSGTQLLVVSFLNSGTIGLYVYGYEFKRFLKNRSLLCCDSFFDSVVCTKLNDLFDAELTRFRNRIQRGKDLTQLTTYSNMRLQVNLDNKQRSN